MNEYLGNNTGLDLDQKVQLHSESLFLFWTVILCINKHSLNTNPNDFQPRTYNELTFSRQCCRKISQLLRKGEYQSYFSTNQSSEKLTALQLF